MSFLNIYFSVIIFKVNDYDDNIIRNVLLFVFAFHKLQFSLIAEETDKRFDPPQKSMRKRDKIQLK